MVSKEECRGASFFYACWHRFRMVGGLLAVGCMVSACTGPNVADRDVTAWPSVMADRVGADFRRPALASHPKPPRSCAGDSGNHLRIAAVFAARGIVRFVDLYAPSAGAPASLQARLAYESVRADSGILQVSFNPSGHEDVRTRDVAGAAWRDLRALLDPLLAAESGRSVSWSDESLWLFQGCWDGSTILRALTADHQQIRPFAGYLADLLDAPELARPPLPYRASAVGTIRSGYLGTPRRRAVAW